MNHDNNKFGIAVKSFYFFTGNYEPSESIFFMYRYTVPSTGILRKQQKERGHSLTDANVFASSSNRRAGFAGAMDEDVTVMKKK